VVSAAGKEGKGGSGDLGPVSQHQVLLRAAPFPTLNSATITIL
jgi:hypothetical protein